MQCRRARIRGGTYSLTMNLAERRQSKRWKFIKTGCSRHIPQGESRSASRASKGERGFWQRRYWKHLIQNESDLARHATEPSRPA
jgi:hypothetical protein